MRILRSLLVLLLCRPFQATGFSLHALGLGSQRHDSSLASSSSSSSSSSLDKAQSAATAVDNPPLLSLTSAYPQGTPPGLVGEAVRSALCSGQCIGWEMSKSPLNFGVMRVQGKGCVAFLNNKLTQSFSTTAEAFSKDNNNNNNSVGVFRTSCLLTSKGRLVDLLGVAMMDPESAHVFTSPGHAGKDLFQRLDPFIFPLDQVTLTDCSEAAFIFTLVSTEQQHLDAVFRDHILPGLNLSGTSTTTEYKLPSVSKDQCLTIPLGTDSNSNDVSTESTLLLITPQTALPECAATGYTFCFLNDAAATTTTTASGSTSNIGSTLWNHLISNDNAQGPVQIGPREFETLRIQAGQPAFGHEMTGADSNSSSSKKNPTTASTATTTTTTTPTSPLELHLGTATTIDLNKGCYLGQEGIASMIKNKRGPPRLLYSVVFEDDFNIYVDQQQQQSDGEDDSSSSQLENLTRVPQPGDLLYVLGSNEEICIGTLCSIAEPAGTGEPVTLGLVLVRRADSILKRIKDMELQLPTSVVSPGPDSQALDDGGSSGIIQPPPLDPLDGVEIIVGGTFTVGRLQMVPSRRYRAGRNMFVDGLPEYVSSMEDEDDDDVDGDLIDVTRIPMMDGGQSLIEATMAAEAADQVAGSGGSVAAEDEDDEDDSAELEKAMKEVAKAQEEAQAAQVEAKRKAEKMEMLQKRAQEAMAKRKQKKKE